MTFLHASLAAAGLACIAIPIIIHLLMHRRRKPVMWGAMRFLLEAYRRQRRRLMLEKWLLLACRCLVVALLALAIGRPLLGRLIGPRAGNTLYILIDNSLTSGVRAPDGTTALERHKATAKSAIDAFRNSRLGAGVGGGRGAGGNEGDRVALVTLGSPPEGVVLPASADLAALARVIDDVEPTDSHADLAGAIDLVAAAIGQSSLPGSAASTRAVSTGAADRTFVAILSEFREGSVDPSTAGASTPDRAAPPPPGAITARLPDGVTILATEPATEPRTNVSVSAVEPLRSVVVSGRSDATGMVSGGATSTSEPPGESSPGAVGAADQADGEGSLLRVLLRRSGSDLAPATTTVRTRILWPERQAGPQAEAPETQAPVRWSRGQDSAMVVVSLPPSALGRGQAAGAVVVSIDEDPLPADNRWRRPIEFRESLRVGIVAPSQFAGGRSGTGISGISPDKLDPGSWARFALAPTTGGGIETVDIEPAAIDAARLAGLDAVILPRPDLLQDSAWARIGLFVAGGGVVMVCPPPSATVHLWSDAMIANLGLPENWSLPRETRRVEGDVLTAGQAAAAATEMTAGSTSGAGDPARRSSPRLLALVEGELEELLRPVRVSTLLPPESVGDSGQVVLRLESGPPVLWAGRPRAVQGQTGDGRGLVVYLGVALSLDWSDLPARPFMVPLMQEIVRQGVGEARGAVWMLAGGRPTWLGSGLVELRRINDHAVGSPRRTAGPADGSESVAIAAGAMAGPSSMPPLRRAGLFQTVDDRGATRGLLAVNPDPQASRVQPQPREVVAGILSPAVGGGAPAGVSAAGAGGGRTSTDGAPAAQRIVWLPAGGSLNAEPTADSDVAGVISGLLGAAEKGSPIDLPLLIAALILAIVEVGLARWASHAEVVPASVRQAAGAMTAGVIGSRPGTDRGGAAA